MPEFRQPIAPKITISAWAANCSAVSVWVRRLLKPAPATCLLSINNYKNLVKTMTQNNWKIQPNIILNACPVMPVMVIQNLEDAVPLAQGLGRRRH